MSRASRHQACPASDLVTDPMKFRCRTPIERAPIKTAALAPAGYLAAHGAMPDDLPAVCAAHPVNWVVVEAAAAPSCRLNCAAPSTGWALKPTFTTPRWHWRRLGSICCWALLRVAKPR